MHGGSWQAWKVYHHEGVEDLKYPTLKKVLVDKSTPLKNAIIKDSRYHI